MQFLGSRPSALPISATRQSITGDTNNVGGANKVKSLNYSILLILLLAAPCSREQMHPNMADRYHAAHSKDVGI